MKEPKYKQSPLEFKDMNGVIICLMIGLAICTGLFCLMLGMLYSVEP